jgi:hypothetical protein
VSMSIFNASSADQFCASLSMKCSVLSR